jgi:hypothetical protein
MQRQQEEAIQEEEHGGEDDNDVTEGAGGAGGLHAEVERNASQGVQASVDHSLEAPAAHASSGTSRLHGQASADSSTGGKRPCPSAPLDPLARGDRREEGPRLSLVTALPRSVWQEHLMPMLWLTAAARLKVVCKALKVLVMEWPMRLGSYMRSRGECRGGATVLPRCQEPGNLLHPAARSGRGVEDGGGA